MGQLRRFVQLTFAEETERITNGAARWQGPLEIQLEKATRGGFLVVRPSHFLDHLAAPWPEALPHDEVMIELKLAANHLDRLAVERALLRRLIREVQRFDEEGAPWWSEEPLWLVAPHVPLWFHELRRPVRFAPGCYRVEPPEQPLLWIAANELPLLDELVPFLLARSGQALDDFCRWVAPRRPLDWVLNMLVYLPMSLPRQEERLWRFGPSMPPRSRPGGNTSSTSSWKPAPRRSSSSSESSADRDTRLPAPGTRRPATHAEQGRRCSHRSVHRAGNPGALARPSHHRGQRLGRAGLKDGNGGR